MSTNQINDHLEWWRARLDAIDDLHNKVRVCYDEADLEQLFTMPTERPYAGVFYENSLGLLPIQSSPGQSEITGMMVQASFSVIVCFDKMETGADDRPLFYQTNLLLAVRRLAMDQKAPAGRKWKFVAELPMGTTAKTKLMVWAQRWSTPIPMTPANMGVRHPFAPC